MWNLRSALIALEGSVVGVATEYAKVSGTLIEVAYDYIVLRANANLLFIPLTSIQNVSY